VVVGGADHTVGTVADLFDVLKLLLDDESSS
jgi:hypothetical protein